MRGREDHSLDIIEEEDIMHAQAPAIPAVLATAARPSSRPRATGASVVLCVLALILALLPAMADAFLYQDGQFLTYMDLDVLRANKELSRRPGVGKRAFAGLLKALRNECDQIVAMGNSTLYSVMAKNASSIAASGDMHDYYSLARYYWPDPTSPTGLPYVRLDGQVNPNVTSVPDHSVFKLFINNIQTLSLGYFFLDEPSYAQETARIVKQWFLDPDTAMNPNLNYASVVRGMNNDFGRNQGVLDFQYTYVVFDAINLIGPYWEDPDDEALHRWFQQYLDWVWTSQFGSMEREMPNNHGTWYRVQVASISLYMNRTDIGAWCAQDMIRMIDDQIDMSRGGLLLEEVIRQASFYYSTYQLRAMFAAARVMKNFGLDILQYQGPQGQSITAAIDYLLPFAITNGTDWPFAKKFGFAATDLLPVLKEAVASKMETAVPGGTKYADAIRILQPVPATHNKARLWFPAGSFDMPNEHKSGAGASLKRDGVLVFFNTFIVASIMVSLC